MTDKELLKEANVALGKVKLAVVEANELLNQGCTAMERLLKENARLTGLVKEAAGIFEDLQEDKKNWEKNQDN